MPIRTQTQKPAERFTFPSWSVVASGGYRPCYMDRARTTFYAISTGAASRFSKLNSSVDGGTTWTSVKDFNTLHTNCDFLGLLELPSGEVLVATSAFGSFAARIYKSTGWTTNPATASWTLKHTMAHCQLLRSYTLNERCLGSNGIVLAGEGGAQTEGLAAMGLTKISGGSGYTTASVTTISGGSGEDIRVSCYNGEVYRIGVFNGGSGHTPGTYAFTISGDGSGASWTYTVLAGGDIDGVQSAAARSLYLSQDYGENWSEIFDVFNPPSPAAHKYGNGLHLHGAAYDQEWGRIWLLTGDNTGDGITMVGGSTNTQVWYSDDLGVTWSILPAELYITTQGIQAQYTAIRVFKNSVVLGTDALNDISMVVLPRTGYRTLGTQRFGSGHRMSNTAIFQQQLSAFSSPDLNQFPVFACYTNSGSADPVLMCTPDGGFTWNEFWRETDFVSRPLASGQSISVMYGPDTSNRMLGYYAGFDGHLKGTLATNF